KRDWSSDVCSSDLDKIGGFTLEIKQAYSLLTNLGVPTAATDISIEERAGQGENIYRLRKREDVWEFLFVRYEKRDGEEKLQATFYDKDTALKFHLLYELISNLFK